MKTVTKGQKSNTSEKELGAISQYCSTHPVFKESNGKATKAISSLVNVRVPEELRKLVK